MRRKLLIALAALGVLLAVLPWLMDGERLHLDDTERARLQQQGLTFARLPSGVIHYELAGPPEGPLVVMVHGVSGPMEVWDAAVGPLHEAGFRTLRFDHFGRGHSERLDRDYDLDLFVGTVEQLRAELAPAARSVHLLGSSMGAIVAAEYTRRHPGEVGRVVLLGPAGFPLEASVLARAIEVPGLGDYLMKVAGDRSLADHNRRYFHDPAPFDAFQRRFEEQLTVVGTKAAILSTMRHTPVQSYLLRYRELGAMDRPVLLVWGRQDPAFPYEHHEEAMEAMPRASLLTVEEAGHLPMLERPQVVMPAVIEHLRSTAD